MPIALPIAASRRGACPSLDAPMRTGDGLLARLRVTGGRLTPVQLAAIATLAGQHGNGQVEISARGNLQVRGLTPASSLPFARAVEAIIRIERGLVVDTPPLAGDDPTEIADARPLAAAIRDRATPLADRLGPKVTVIVDGHGQITLADLKADIRLRAHTANRWSVAIANAVSVPLPSAAAIDLVQQTLRHLAALGPTARSSDLDIDMGMMSQSSPSPWWGGIKGGGDLPPLSAPASPPIGSFRLLNGSATGIALPFGATDWRSLAALADTATRLGITEFRLAPHHALLAIDAPAAFATDAAALGFIADAADPRLRISACIGSLGCASGHVPARAIAMGLAARLPPGASLHVSGCAKGCAHPRRATVTLVGRSDGYGLVISGTAGDTPQALLQADGLESALAGTSRQG